MAERYTAHYGRNGLQLDGDTADFIWRRTEPFLKDCAMRSLRHLLAEAYIQGARDVLDVQAAA